MGTTLSRIFISLWLGIVLFGCVQDNNLPPKAAIATAHHLATEAGFEILEQGGNAFDAAVAVSAALAVVEPMGSGLGGGGFWLLHEAENNRDIMIDGREKAPLRASRDMYLDPQGEPISGLSMNGALAAGIPGLPAGLVHLATRYGQLPLETSLAPAIRYAEKGFVIGEHYRKMSGFRLSALRDSVAASRVFLSNGEVMSAGAKLIQPDLALTLRSLAAQGRAGFYSGEVADKLLAGVQTDGGIWTQADLDTYKIIERTPVTGSYRGVTVTSAALPSSGGVVLVAALNILSQYDLAAMNEIDRKHLIIEAMRRAYHDRARYLGDADFIAAELLPLKRLLAKDYALQRSQSINLSQATKSEDLALTAAKEAGGENTTHFSILDKDGNRVAATLSINYPFGSGFMPAGTGVVLNNEMDDFSMKIGTPNGYELVGNEANSIVPGKRMLSSMSPTFLEDGDRVAILGTPGGSRIISMVLLAILDFEASKPAESWVSLPRFHHQYLPDVVQYEQGGLDAETVSELALRGHELKEMKRRYGNMQAILWDKRLHHVEAASDPRGEGLAMTR